MGNIVPRAGPEPTSLAFRAIAPHMLDDVTTLPTPTCLCTSLPQRSVWTNYTCLTVIINLLMLTITYTQAMVSHKHTQGRFNEHTVHSLYRILVTAPVLWLWRKWGNIVPRARLRSTSLVFWASFLPLTPCRFPDVITIPTPVCLCSCLP